MRSSQQSAHFGAQASCGAYDIVVAAGVEVMSTTPMGASVTPAASPWSPGHGALRAPGRLGHAGHLGRIIAAKWDISREDMDAYAVQSPQRAAAATAEGRFDHEIIPVQAKISRRDEQQGHRARRDGPADEGIRPDSIMESRPSSSGVRSRERSGHRANSSQITDGASAILIMSEEKARELSLKPRARFHSFSVCGVDPIEMLTGPIPATTKVLEKAGMTLDQMDLIEINEAFASVVLAWQKEHNPDMSKVNVNGGAIALGHPLGCSGAKLMATLLNELERTGGRFGLQTIVRARDGQRHHHRRMD